MSNLSLSEPIYVPLSDFDDESSTVPASYGISKLQYWRSAYVVRLAARFAETSINCCCPEPERPLIIKQP